MKIISIANRDGPIGECTAKCYDAPVKTPCRCVCRGSNHGKGEAYALANAPKLAAKFGHCEVKVDPRAQQQTLWTDPDDLQRYFPPRNAGPLCGRRRDGDD